MESSKPRSPFTYYGKRVILWTGMIIIALLLLIWVSSPLIARWQVNELLSAYNKKLSDDSSIRLNPFLLHLTIYDLNLQDIKADDAYLTLGSAEIDIGLWGLFSKELSIEKFKFNQLSIEVNRDGNLLEVAGFDLTADAPAQPQTEVPGETDEQTSDNQTSNASSEPWLIVADNLLLSDIKFNINNSAHQHTVSFDSIDVSQVKIDEKQQNLALNIKAQIDQGTLDIKADLTNQKEGGQLNLELDLENFHLADIAYLTETQLAKLSGIVEFHVAQNIQYQGSNVAITLPSASLAISSLESQVSGANLKNQALTLNAKNFQINALPEQAPQLSGEFDLQNQGLTITTDINEQIILDLSKIELNQGKIKLSDSPLPTIQLKDIQLEELTVSEDQSDSDQKQPPLAKIKHILLSQLSLDNQHIGLDKFIITELHSNPILDKDKQIANLILPQAASSNNQENDAELPNESESDTSASTENPLTFSLNEFAISDKSQLVFNDLSVTPNFEQAISISEVQAKNIDNRQANNQIDFTVKFKTDAYAASELVGNIKPFAEKMNLQLDSKVREFSLPKVSPYVKDAMGFEMLSGQFDTDTKVIIKDDIIEGESNLAIRGLELSAADEAEANSLKDQTALPLNSALGMLKDDKGNLELEIPLSGNVSEPEFGVSSFIALVTKKAVMSAAESYLIETFIPYANVLSVVRIAGEYMLKVDFEDLEFSPQSVTIEETQQQFVNEFIALMKKEADTQVKVCAIATRADLPDVSANFEDNQYTEQLTKISQQRGQSFKAWVVEKGEIESSRLLLCQPQIDQDEEAKPRIEFEV